ncbi:MULTISPECIES: small acid-soluble spore protein SspI [Thermoactinomyces]|jgi:small acid-soluble spore protein I (minor)|uniref:Small, acid-soluble spore protein I n=1 Tax=Thermoactinomyces vulgaris TaxID=2026 RepID=A0ABS0QFS6_THEVU|nr:MULTISPECIES: small acid-soluble spore protein SspI [Thermoactinomyces]KFZ41358.1 small acid-soluble spore protein SspI [Thermoactinomyces sp. Gus2-1]KYQ87461.1 small, acid-soluble spore protein I [Thermoactinomyces sp. AS95]MBA4551383.1 small acid-soluble spore protein SspI [Thermoactinomyces vulgaris]MBA4595407.1 small acid-soluble spore protein SspI [Thermoactinomyces vulgaris]MBH8583928.1 small acid-soluble spore protein SspI [Thermoactinomyces sp. CICC 10735]
MNFDIRGAVIHNIHNMNEEELQELVVDSIQQREEKLLPGLGVLFEVIWKNSTEEERQEMIETLRESLSKQ